MAHMGVDGILSRGIVKRRVLGALLVRNKNRKAEDGVDWHGVTREKQEHRMQVVAFWEILWEVHWELEEYTDCDFYFKRYFVPMVFVLFWFWYSDVFCPQEKAGDVFTISFCWSV